MNCSFAAILNFVLLVMNVSNTRLARDLSVHPSLITRWRGGGRVPPKNSNYIDKFVALLRQLDIRPEQSELIREFFIFNHIPAGDSSADIYQSIAEALFSARQAYHDQQAEQGQATLPDLHLVPLGQASAKGKTSPQGKLSLDGRGQCETVFGEANVISAVTSLLLEASGNENQKKKELLILSVHNRPPRGDSQSYRILGLSGLYSRLLMRKWWMTVLLCQEGNQKKPVGYDDYLAQFSDYEHFSVSTRTASAPPMLYPELVAIPGLFALLAFSSGFGGELDAAFIFRDQPSVDYFCESFYYMFAESTPVTILTGQPGRGQVTKRS